MSQSDDRVAAAGAVTEEFTQGLAAVEVVGPLRRARFPELCVRCGARADRRLRLLKLFYHDNSDDSGYYFTDGVDAPACAECLRSHQSEVRPIDPEVRRKLVRSWFWASVPYFVPLGVITWMLSMFLPNLLAGLVEGDMAEALVWGVVCAFFGSLGLMFLGIIHRAGQKLIVTPWTTPVHVQTERGPLGSRLIVPVDPTTVQRAVDFSEDRSELFERERHRFTFQNHEVAARFAELNADREWDPASPGAQLAKRARWALAGAVVLFVLYALVTGLI